MSDFLDEARRELRQEQMVNFLRKNRTMIVVVILCLLAGTAAGTWYKTSEQNRRAEDGEVYRQALAISFQDAAKGAESFADVASKVGVEYKPLALMRQAQLMGDNEQYDKALALFDTLAKTAGMETSMRELAELQAVRILTEQYPDDASIPSRLAALTKPEGAWRYLAMEIEAVYAISQEQWMKGNNLLKKMLQNEDLPSRLRGRVSTLHKIASKKAAVGAAQVMLPAGESN